MHDSLPQATSSSGISIKRFKKTFKREKRRESDHLEIDEAEFDKTGTKHTAFQKMLLSLPICFVCEMRLAQDTSNQAKRSILLSFAYGLTQPLAMWIT